MLAFTQINIYWPQLNILLDQQNYVEPQQRQQNNINKEYQMNFYLPNISFKNSNPNNKITWNNWGLSSW